MSFFFSDTSLLMCYFYSVNLLLPSPFGCQAMNQGAWLAKDVLLDTLNPESQLVTKLCMISPLTLNVNTLPVKSCLTRWEYNYIWIYLLCVELRLRHSCMILHLAIIHSLAEQLWALNVWQKSDYELCAANNGRTLYWLIFKQKKRVFILSWLSKERKNTRCYF